MNLIEKAFVENPELDDYFPKGDKRRGQVLSLLARLHVDVTMVAISKDSLSKILEDIESEIEEFRKVLRKENVEKGIEDLIELLYGKLSDEDVRILEIHILERQKEVLKKLTQLPGEKDGM